MAGLKGEEYVLAPWLGELSRYSRIPPLIGINLVAKVLFLAVVFGRIRAISLHRSKGAILYCVNFLLFEW